MSAAAELAPAKPAIDKDALLKKYRAERDKRLREDGSAQYLRLEGHLAVTAEDPAVVVANATIEVKSHRAGGVKTSLIRVTRASNSG